MKKILISLGTRAEAIKLFPLISELKRRKYFDIIVLSTGQHNEMLKCESFYDFIDYDLQIMQKNQSLSYITQEILSKAEPIFKKEAPNLVLVQGDTASAYAAALCAFYLHLKIGHIEAGLRTGNILSPFPEEFNRRSISLISSLHFAPTESDKINLIREGIDENSIFVVGNTVIDALFQDINGFTPQKSNKRLLILTLHRKELNIHNYTSAFLAVRDILTDKSLQCLIICSKNESVRRLAENIFCNIDNASLCDFIPSPHFHRLMLGSYLIISDSGGISEEAAALGLPLICVRNENERSCANICPCGKHRTDIYSKIKTLLYNKDEYNKFKVPSLKYGDGKASAKIADIIEALFNQNINL